MYKINQNPVEVTFARFQCADADWRAALKLTFGRHAEAAAEAAGHGHYGPQLSYLYQRRALARRNWVDAVDET